jgi:acetolactate synthase-1/2/3 large subunit
MTNYTGATALLEALVLAGVTHLFVNLGSDHPALLEVISKWRREGRSDLKVLTAPNEFVGLCAAQGYYQATGKMQAILVHVDAGTLAMAGAIHNVARARIPVLMIAGNDHLHYCLFRIEEHGTYDESGTSPITEENEMIGTRNVCLCLHWREFKHRICLVC